MQKLPKFSNGKPLIEIPKYIPTIGFLEGDFGKAVLEEYKERAEKDYNNASALKVLSYKDNIVKGSNPFAVALVNKIVGQERYRTATQSDLEKAIKYNSLPLRGQYEDTGLVLKTEEGLNDYLAKNLMSQIKRINPKAKMPAMISLSDLDLVKDKNSPHKLAFKLKDSANVFYDLSVLNKNGKFSSEDIDEKTGLPNKTGENGNRTLYTTSKGLSRFYLCRDLVAGSNDGDLANSGDYGRVVVVSECAEGTAQNFERRFYNDEDLKVLKGVKDGSLASNELEKIISRFS